MAREPVLEFENRQELKAMMDGLKVQRERMIWIVFSTNKSSGMPHVIKNNQKLQSDSEIWWIKIQGEFLTHWLPSIRMTSPSAVFWSVKSSPWSSKITLLGLESSFLNFQISTFLQRFVHTVYLYIIYTLNYLQKSKSCRWFQKIDGCFVVEPICQVHSISYLHIEQQHHLDANHLFDICHQKRIHLLALKWPSSYEFWRSKIIFFCI